ncbi:alpha/beta hydrolase [Novosphingobium pokkalii]|uniref:Alpha/beta hydrolase n=1 Tax=Novosphingobium pokkalii TaxID=1770194 RepID=A0ABV7V8P4_9SPHN|nr:alpha/beta hydrolase [Novosphingobium pokkalii]GHD01026.1 xylanase [Novosphingobium pokkalii]
MDESGNSASGWTRRAVLPALTLAAAALNSNHGMSQTIPRGLKLPPLPTSWNRVERIPLWPGALPGTGFRASPVPPDFPDILVRNVARPELRVFPPPAGTPSNGLSLLVLPGGAYSWVSILNEGIEIAGRFGTMGYTTFVLVYRLPGEGWSPRADVSLADARRAVQVIRRQAPLRHLRTDGILVAGFSAGGHLAASLATRYKQKIYPAIDALDDTDARPAVVGAIYPVISLSPDIGHHDSTSNLVGPNPDAEAIARHSPALQVSTETPPMFLAHAVDDAAVNPANTLAMMQALMTAKRPVEAHFFEKGGHAFGAGRAGQPNRAWPDLFHAWAQTHLA